MPVTLTVAFPLPDIDLAEADNYAFPVGDPNNFVGFETKVDGKPIALTMNQRAMLGDKDVSAALRSGRRAAAADRRAREAHSRAARRRRAKSWSSKVCLVQSGSNERGRPIYGAAWTVKMSAVRQQTFPPGKPVLVEHRYKTSLGVSVDTCCARGCGRTRRWTRKSSAIASSTASSDAFLAALDKMGGAAEPNTGKLREWRISYVFKTGANWAGPIKAFRLVVDKGKAERHRQLLRAEHQDAVADHRRVQGERFHAGQGPEESSSSAVPETVDCHRSSLK